MSSPDLILFWIAFTAYFLGFLLYTFYFAFQRKVLAFFALAVMILGFMPQTAAFIFRWVWSEHIPLANMYEYLGLMSWMAVLCLFILLALYKKPILGAFIAPFAFMLMVTASLLPKQINQSLMPALQSYWLTIHVSLAALGSGAFAVSCAVSLVYLLKKGAGLYIVNPHKDKLNIISVLSAVIFPVIFAGVIKFLGLLPDDSGFRFNFGGAEVSGLNWIFTGIGLSLPFASTIWYFAFRKLLPSKYGQGYGASLFSLVLLDFLLSALISGLLVRFDIIHLTEGTVWRLFDFLGCVWFISIVLFIPLTIIWAGKVKKLFQNARINPEQLEEINYRSISIGYPLYTVGALFAGAIWAERAWGTFWSWDPKEVSALIIWLFYTGFLHARRQAHWRGVRSAILAIFGLLMILLSFFGNYFFGGQHSYI
jgi:ABC-type transport system involved in cytochrome c biogenesis permease subunit